MLHSTESLLTVNNLSVSFQSGKEIFHAVDNISFNIQKGKTLGIVGESGSGKSVTSLALMRLIPQPPGNISSGSAIFTGKSGTPLNLFALDQNEMRKLRGNEIAMIFQEPMTSLNPVFTCGFQVAEAIRIHNKISVKQAREQTIALFNKVKLPRAESLFDSYPHQLSGGQKQRVMIAMAISCNPLLLIADEPTTALDVTVQASILKLLKDIQLETGMSMIFITHDLGVIAEFADDVMVMYKGKQVEHGNTRRIFSEPQHPYTKGLLACRPAGHTGLTRLPVISDFMRTDPDGTFHETGNTVNELVSTLKHSSSHRKQKLTELYKKQPVLEVQSLETYFPVKKGLFGKGKEVVKAVDDVSFSVYPGETLGLVGESGCGKTTLGRSVLRLIEPTGGNISYNGRDIRSLDSKGLRAMRKQMQLIFQDPYSSLNPRMTAGAAIKEPMEVHNLYGSSANRRNKVYELLEKTGLKPEHYNRYPHQFSGGQRQRICIARALSLNPEFIICDESVSALDVSVQAQVLNLLNELKEQQGLTYIFISHDLSVVRFMSDRILVMNKGKVEEIGDAEEVCTNPSSPYTKKLLESIPKG